MIRSIVGDVQQNLAKGYFAKIISLSRIRYHLHLCQNNLTNFLSEGYRSKKCAIFTLNKTKNDIELEFQN
jgi:hypothetical protein